MESRAPSFLGTLVCVHGFLGQARDWDSVLPDLERVVCPDFFSSNRKVRGMTSGFRGEFSFRALGAWLREQVRDLPRPHVLLGYSWGGRVALASLMDDSLGWDAGILVSTHPGLRSSEERAERLKSDRVWAEAFLHSEWNDLMTRWNQQSVLKGSSALLRREEDFSRSALSEALLGCSLGVQPDFRGALASCASPLLWLVGAEDAKFLKLAEELGAGGRVQVRTIPQAGHRAPWDQPEAFREQVERFLAQQIVL